MAGSFALPIKYGYCCVGRVLAAGAMGGAAAGEALTGRLVYTMHPHQDRFVAPVGRLLPLPVGLPPRRGALVPAFETALNAIWDAAPGLPTPLRSPADTEPDTQPRGRIAVVGGGLIGLAIACLLPRLGYGPALVVERSAARRQRIAALAARGLPLLAVAPREAEPGGFDCVFHTSATGAGLSLALSLLGFEGQVVELSWYGRRRVRLALGGGFHYRRQRLLSSQVSAIAAPRRGQVDHRGRLAEVLRLLAGPEYDALLAPWISFDNLPAYLAALCAGARPAFAQPVRYPAAQDEVDLDL
jgi:threonine dehydrogenase-like Zn-dependent dehydrogenase